MNFNSVFEELNKLYEEKPAKEEPKVADGDTPEEEVVEACAEEGCQKEELTEAADDEIEIVDEEPAEDIPVEEAPVEEPEARQLILECAKCGALVIKDEADVVFDEESDLVNVEDECEYCEEKEGYKIIGVVAPYEAAEIEVVDEEPVEEGLLDLDVSPNINITANDNEVAVGGATI